jgi:protein-S-isoprenylcysteine O-methyltransferase Ste14
MFLALVGLAALLSSPEALVVSIGFVAYIDRFQVRPEERVLRVLFGAEYEAYRARVRRWV